MKIFGLTAVCLVIALTACSGPRSGQLPAGDRAVPTTDPKTWELTPVEKAWADAKRKTGGLVAASVVREGAFEYNADPERASGLHAKLVRALGVFLNLPVRFQSVAVEDFFTKNGKIIDGVKTDPTVAYEPDIFSRADLAATDITDLAWRKKLMDLHPVILNRMVLAAPRALEIHQLSDLYHKRIVVMMDSSHEQFLRQLQTDLDLDFTVVSVPYTTDLFTVIRQGKADAMVQDANWVMLSVQANKDFNVTLPLRSNEWLSWGTSKKDPVFGGIIDKFLAKVRADGTWDSVWKASYGVPYGTYLNLIGNDPPPVWTDADQAVLTTLKKTGLRIALHREASEYETLPDGSTRGVLYNLILEVAKRLGVPVKITPVEFQDFFAKDGKFPDKVKTDPGFTYKPDLFNKVDFYAGDFTPLEWRKKFMTFVSVYPSKLVYVVRKQDGPRGYGPGKKFALVPDTSYDDWIKAHGSVKPGDIVPVTTEEEAAARVSDGRADYTLSDANVVIAMLQKFPGITFFPADSHVDDLSWAVYKGNDGLATVLGKALDGLRTSGTFSAVWQNYFHVSLTEYLGLLALDTGSAP